MFAGLMRRLRPVPVVDGGAFEAFLKANAAFVAQKSVSEYCRAKTSVFSNLMFREPAFLEAMSDSFRIGFAATLADLTLVAEGYLRPHAADGDALRSGLAAMYVRLLRSESPPRGRAVMWDEAEADFGPRIARAGMAPPRPARGIAEYAAARMFEALPLHPDIVRYDREVFSATVAFLTVSFRDTLEKRVDAPAVARAISGPPP
ncbi:MAG: hypothetical protein WD270_00385 [Acetobacterales bacterium]